MNPSLQEKLKTSFHSKNIEFLEGIPLLLNKDFINGSNEKYKKMYDWMSTGYDFAEKVVGRLKYGNAVKQLRADLMSRIEWQDNLKILYVSIGTGQDLNFIPSHINKSSLDITGVDISLGMLYKCRAKFKNKLNLSLVNCCAEDLPFQDETFDIVFHVGGINFFNDKKLAMNEMMRVAKKGTKIIVADETSEYIDSQYKKSFFSKKYFKDVSCDLSEIESCVPINAKNFVTEYLWEKKFYCLSFRKD